MTFPKRQHRHPLPGVATMLLETRERLGLSYRAAARLSGVSFHHIKHLEAGDSNPSTGVFVALCEAYGRDPCATLRELLERRA